MVLYSVVFVLYSVMEVLGLMPQEVRSAGITLPALFANYYGDQVLAISIHVYCTPSSSTCTVDLYGTVRGSATCIT